MTLNVLVSTGDKKHRSQFQSNLQSFQSKRGHSVITRLPCNLPVRALIT